MATGVSTRQPRNVTFAGGFGMRRITRLAWTVSLGAVLLAFGAKAQSNPGFTAATPVAPFTATTGGVTATMPAGPAIVVTNTGATNAVYCQQGPTASTSSQYIASGSWFEFARINGQTQMTCITATSTTTVNMVGGVGQASGGGGGGGGGGGPTANVSIVSPLGSSLSAASVAVVIASDQGAVPTTDNVAKWDGTALGAPSNYGTSPGAVAVPGVNAFVTNTVTVTGTGGTFPATQSTSPWIVAGGGTAGAAATGVVTIQGIASMTKLLVTPDSVALPANQSVNVAQVNGTTTLVNTGAVGTGAQRVAVGTDTATIAGSAPGTAGSASTNVVTVQGIASGTTLPTQQSSQYPVGTVAETASATGTTGATTATLATNTGQTTSICGFSIRANATAAATNNATVTGTITGTLNFTQWTAPLASGLGVTEMIFTPCIPASTTNTSIAVISGAPGSGGVVSVSAWGFLK